MKEIFPENRPVLALAPMQDVADLAFWKLAASFGGADIYFTEYFRVTVGYRPERKILDMLTRNPTGRPAVAQIIGNDIAWMAKTAKALEKYPVAAIDLNLGCPAPVVYRKCAGGGLLRDLARLDDLLAALRESVAGRLSVKTRVGFADAAEFDAILELFGRHRLDMVTVHGRTVAEKYGAHVHLDRIAQAVRALSCPVIANGGASTCDDALRVLEVTGARGVMVGRGAVRNPWIFAQIRNRLEGRDIPRPTGRDLLAYIEALFEACCSGDVPEKLQAQKMKKYMNFVGEGIGEKFLHAIRRVETKREFFSVCRGALDHAGPAFAEGN